MAYDVRSMQARAKQLLKLEKRGIVDRSRQARHMGLSVGHVSRIRGWVNDHGIGREETRRPPNLPPTLIFGKPPLTLPDHFYATLTVKLPSTVVETLRAYCEKKNITIESAVDIALGHYLKTRPR